MEYLHRRSCQDRPQSGFYVFTSFVGGLVRNTSLLMILLCLSFAAAVGVINIVKSLRYHPVIRSFVAALEGESADTDSTAHHLDTELPPRVKDPMKIQREENRQRRKLAAELRRSKSSGSRVRAVRHLGSGI
jgi:hypothetical protein